MNREEIKELEEFCRETRRLTVEQIASLGLGHIGGALSMVELLAVLYNKCMHVDPKDPKMEGRDRLVLSKGHCGPGLYTVLAQKGFYPIEELYTLNKPGTILPSHVDMLKTPGIDMSTGSLGQGLSCAAGMAKASKILGDGAYVYAIVGDGECQEGQIWEAAMTISQYCLDNLITFVDVNKAQCDGWIDEIVNMRHMKDRWESFGFFVQEVDGHDVEQIYEAVTKAKETKGIPHAILLNTVKGKGFHLFESMGAKCHHIPVTEEMKEQALAELEQED
ncbi:MAG: transketolase [Lachnospiraceae bacterium]|nr:transketolase [Lachnospiraceae bacterium]